MDVFIASFILIVAISVGVSHEPQDQVAPDPVKNTATADASSTHQGDMSACTRQRVQIIERDLTVQADEEATTDDS
jgi:hypothetical protein